MSTYNKEKYYWLKLKRDFFKRHDIKVLRSLENGDKYALFYLQLMCEAIDHEGELRFSETIPYDEKMLSAITDTDIDIVRSALKALISLGMVECLEDRTFYIQEVQKLIGSTTVSAEKKQEQIARRRLQISGGGKRVENYPPEIEIEKEIEIEVSKQVSNKDKNILLSTASASAHARESEENFKTQSYEELLDDCCVDGEYRKAVFRFIAHLNTNGIKVINDRLEKMVLAVDREIGKNDNYAKAAYIDDAISKGYKYLPCEERKYRGCD